MATWIAHLLIGGASGFLAGLLGAGGGFVTMVLLLASGMSNHEAVGTSLVYTAALVAWGSALHMRQGTGNGRLSMTLGIPAALTAYVAADLTLSYRAFNLSFAVLTGSAAVAFLTDPRRRQVPRVAGAQVDAPQAIYNPTPAVLAGAAIGGAAIGLLQGMFGVGGGFLLVPFMVIALGTPERVAVGSSLFAILPGAAAGGARHALLGNVNWTAFAVLSVGAVGASYAGARLVPKVRPATLRWSFIALLACTTTFLVVRAFV